MRKGQYSQPGQAEKSTLRQQVQKQARRERRLAVSVAALWCLLIGALSFLLILSHRVRVMETRMESAALSARTGGAEKEEGRAGSSGDAQTQPAVDDVMGPAVGTVKEDYPDLWGLDWVDRPVSRTGRQVLERLSELAEDNELISEIYKNRGSYPDKMLEALANNPEMAGFVAGYPEKREEPIELTDSEKEQEFPLFLQWDPRWGYRSYGDGSNIGLAGCGPTCISMALYYLTGDESLTPDVIAEYGMQNGYYVSGVGTAWALLEDVPAMYGVNVASKSIDEENLLAALNGGGVLICSMSSGDFTAAGHFIVIYGYDSEGFLVNDPNCVARSRMHWSWDSLRKQIKNVWAYNTGKSGSQAVEYR